MSVTNAVESLKENCPNSDIRPSLLMHSNNDVYVHELDDSDVGQFYKTVRELGLETVRMTRRGGRFHGFLRE